MEDSPSTTPGELRKPRIVELLLLVSFGLNIFLLMLFLVSGETKLAGITPAQSTSKAVMWSKVPPGIYHVWQSIHNDSTDKSYAMVQDIDDDSEVPFLIETTGGRLLVVGELYVLFYRDPLHKEWKKVDEIKPERTSTPKKAAHRA